MVHPSILALFNPVCQHLCNALYYRYTSDDTVVEGEIEAGKVYEEADFNRSIEIREREKKRVEIFLSQIVRTQRQPPRRDDARDTRPPESVAEVRDSRTAKRGGCSLQWHCSAAFQRTFSGSTKSFTWRS
jgi:hypothetical protein